MCLIILNYMAEKHDIKNIYKYNERKKKNKKNLI